MFQHFLEIYIGNFFVTVLFSRKQNNKSENSKTIKMKRILKNNIKFKFYCLSWRSFTYQDIKILKWKRVKCYIKIFRDVSITEVKYFIKDDIRVQCAREIILQ